MNWSEEELRGWSEEELRGWSEEALQGTGLTVADVEEIEALARRLSGMGPEELTALRAEIEEIEASPDSTQAQLGFATVLGAGCKARARGENPEPVLTMLFKMRTEFRERGDSQAG